MNPTERLELLEDLRSGKMAIAAALAGVSEEIARRKPGDERWSILECMEHVALAEAHMLRQTMTSTTAAEPRQNAIRERAIRERATDRTRRVKAPEVAEPSGRYLTLLEAVEAFNTSRDQAITFVERFEGDLRTRQTEHPLLGPVNGFENLLIMVSHSFRHAKQIQE